ncbi:hypothetical protein [Devosia marina]|uniref:Uncharacterized protein n=1 Tax=Devosia marina TaxID=2683198 RepID=A0A7X3FUV5_9HYPH|nr:hypothetical protein [Devosia marina]MVT01054.1 hypothetical protein [Devosia marina]
MAVFKTKRLKGVDYHLDHLDPFQFALAVDQASYTVEVHFSCHCFTEEIAAHHTPDLYYSHAGERRAFNMDRYDQSKLLPGLIASLGNRSVYYTRQVNYFFLRDMPNLVGPYVVFFDPAKAKKTGVDVLLNVQSAYCKPGMTDRAAPVRFTTLVEATAKANPVNRGPIQQIKRK